MIKPLWALAGVALLGTAGVAGGVIIASPGGEEEVVQQVETATPTPDTSASQTATPEPLLPTPAAPAATPLPPDVTLYRWANLTVLIPDGSGVMAGPGAVAGAGRALHFVIAKIDPEDSRIASTVVLDAETGAIVEEDILIQHRPELLQVLATLSVSAFDSALAPWPYNGEPSPDVPRENEGGISWMRPAPATGLYVGWGIGDPGGFFIDIRNERSTAFVTIDPITGGLVFDTSPVLAEDLDTFERWLATVKRCDTEIEC